MQRPRPRYQLDELIAAGAAARVYTGTDTHTGRAVALKRLRLDIPQVRVERERLIREGRLLGRLNHTHLVDIYDVIIDGPEVSLILGLVEGVDLRRLMVAFSPLMPLVVVPAVIQAARALSALHRRGVVHRDVKPANILIDSSGRARLCDLGAAHVVASPRPGDEGRVVGSPAFVAPEVITGEVATAAADLYALGVVLYQGLTGQLPFTGADHHHVFHARLTSEAVDVRQLNPMVPEPLAAVVRRLMAPAPGDRFESADALADALEALPAAWPGSRARRLLRDAVLTLREAPLPVVAPPAAEASPSLPQPARITLPDLHEGDPRLSRVPLP